MFRAARRPTRALAGVLLAILAPVALLVLVAGAAATSSTQTPPFMQDWANTGLITVSDDWSGVPGVQGFRGDALTSVNDVDPQTVLAEGLAVLDVNASQTNPNTFTTGGVAEFEIADPVVALQGSGTADAPHLVLYLNTTGMQTVVVAYNLRDIDSSTDNAVQQVALQYRVGGSGSYTNVPAGYVADATTGPSLATLVTPVNVTLPAAVDNQPLVEVRIITTNATGNDEWVGVDDISVTASPTGGDSAPTVTATTPANGVTDVAPTSNVVVTFSEPVNVTGTWFAISCATSGSHTAAVTGGPQVFTLNPDSDFSNSELCTVTIFANQVTDQDANDPPDNMTADFNLSFTTAAAPVPIYDLQGSGASSPFVGMQKATTGVVMVVLGSGFFMQDPAGDGNPATSDGMFVFSGSAVARTLAPGDTVSVTGTVVEFRPSTRPRDLTLTEFSPATVVETGTGAIPAPVAIDNRPDTVISPDGIDQFERLEGMLVAIDVPRVTGPTNSFGEFVVVPSGDAASTTPNGNIIVEPLGGGGVDYNPERVMVDDEARVPGGTGTGVRINNPQANVVVGDVAGGDIVGALDYQFSNYRVQANHLVSNVLPNGTPSGSPVAGLPNPEPFEGRIATFNVENLFDCVDAPGKDDDHPTCNPAALTALDRQLTKLAAAFQQELKSPELVIIEETESTEVLTGDANGLVPGTTLQALLPRISGNWDAVSFDASDERGIEVGFVFNTDHVTLDDAYLATTILPDGGVFSGSPTIRPGREPLVAHFTLDDLELVVVGNHFKSKGGPQFGIDPIEAGDDPLYGAFQPPTRWTETLRHQQADYVRDLVDLLLQQAPGANILVGGDLNDFWFGEPGEGQDTVARIADSLTDPLANAVELVPPSERYTFVFEGNSQVLDHLLLNAPLQALLRDQAIAHFNADYPDSFGLLATTTQRSSDHDPLVAYFCTDLTPPTLTVSASPSTLFPPNHKYRTVTASFSSSDNSGVAPTVTLISVTSNEPDNAPGGADGNTVDDIVITNPTTFRLRAERDENATGRIYTITYRARDACGNTTIRTATVTVPVRS